MFVNCQTITISVISEVRESIRSQCGQRYKRIFSIRTSCIRPANPARKLGENLLILKVLFFQLSQAVEFEVANKRHVINKF